METTVKIIEENHYTIEVKEKTKNNTIFDLLGEKKVVPAHRIGKVIRNNLQSLLDIVKKDRSLFENTIKHNYFKYKIDSLDNCILLLKETRSIRLTTL